MKLSELWVYSSVNEMLSEAGNLIIFGAEVFKRAKAIRELSLLKALNVELKNGVFSDPILEEFFFEHLIDNIRFLLFFENYMKAELLCNGFCIHVINESELHALQNKRPIKLKEINDREPFQFNLSHKWVKHPFLSDKTLPISILLNEKKYYSLYRFDKNMLDFLKTLNKHRNTLHRHKDIQFNLSDTYIKNLEEMDNFVNRMLGEVKSF